MSKSNYNTAKPSGTVTPPPVTQGSRHDYMISGKAPHAGNTGAGGKNTTTKKF
jgi:hypothetical protein